jgi:hypothetical protein
MMELAIFDKTLADDTPGLDATGIGVRVRPERFAARKLDIERRCGGNRVLRGQLRD